MNDNREKANTFTIRAMQPGDREEVIAMMRVFYDSPALLTDIPDEVLVRNVDACLSASPFVEGLIIESPAASGTESNPAIAGYSILAKSFSTEFGGPCVWIEDIYLREEYRGCGAGSAVLSFVKAQHPEAVITRLEVETENVPAIAAYRKAGYSEMGYTEMYLLKED